MFHFRFIGDSTTRRLVDSFEALYTGIKPAHVLAHTTVDHRVGALDATYEWTPHCKDFPTSIANSTSGLDDPAQKVVVIVTQFGIHDITTVERSKIAMDQCLDVTQQLIDFAQQQSIGGLRPIVLFMQGNPFMEGDERSGWMDELLVRRLEVLQNGEINNLEGNSSGRFYLLEDTASIFNKFECKRMDGSVHFSEPVKLIQAKMLWHIMTIISNDLDPGYSQ
ncbi:unnamed protein product [Choristocarpus tenellus]